MSTVLYSLTVILRSLSALSAVLCFSVFPGMLHCALAEHKEFIVDGVVASVDGQPITLYEVLARLNPPRKLTFKEASLDPEARYVLDTIITERLVLEEAKAKKIGVGAGEIEKYISEVASKNNLSSEEFEKALKKENKSLAEYKRQVKIEILRTRLVAAFLQQGVGVSDSEIKDYIAEHAEFSKAGSKVKLRHIFISKKGRTEEEAKKILSEARKKLINGADFAKIAQEISQSPDAQTGGELGVLVEEDLNSDIFDAVFSLKEGELSDIVFAGGGYHIFRVEKRFVSKGGDEKGKDKEKLYDEVRTIIKRQKLETKMQTFFTTDLYKSHAVDKKM